MSQQNQTQVVNLTLYVRYGCHLCEDMRAVLASFEADLGFTCTLVDIDRDPMLQQRFGHLVPVLALDGQEICHYFLDKRALEQALADFQQSGPTNG